MKTSALAEEKIGILKSLELAQNNYEAKKEEADKLKEINKVKDKRKMHVSCADGT